MLVLENTNQLQNPEMSGIFDILLDIITPSKPLPYVIGGAVILSIGSMDRFKGTFARPALIGTGGVVLGIGLLPFVIDAVKKAGG